MKTPVFILTVFALTCTFSSCRQQEIQFQNIQWKTLDSIKGISWGIATQGNGKTATASVRYYGAIVNNQLVKDSVKEDWYAYDWLVSSLMKDNKTINALPEGTMGYVKIYTKEFIPGYNKDNAQFEIFFEPGRSVEQLKMDSAKLLATNYFNRIGITTSEKAAIKMAEGETDTSFKDFLRTNPLPPSLDVTLKREFLSLGKIDSIKSSLGLLLPDANINMTPSTDFIQAQIKLPDTTVYKFIIF
ncbi:MAG: hypothetical protein JST86_05915 [Bacteroidetes bacterium]|nr:hypothetical protein [Bacteroidota bacterium]